MGDNRTCEELERRLDSLCDRYLLHPHNEVIGKEIIELRKRLSELKANLMKLKIFLDLESYQCLKEHITHAPSRAAIDTAVQLGNTRVIECDDTVVRDLLVCAQNHCPDAARRIIEAIRAAGLVL